jgi:hypothetical protein
VSGLSPVIMTVRMPTRPNIREALLDTTLHDVFELHHTQRAVVVDHDTAVWRPGARRPSTVRDHLGGTRAPRWST